MFIDMPRCCCRYRHERAIYYMLSMLRYFHYFHADAASACRRRHYGATLRRYAR